MYICKLESENVIFATEKTNPTEKTNTNFMSILTQINNPERVFLSLLFLLISNFCYAENVIVWTPGATINNDVLNVEANGNRDYRIKIQGNINMNGYIQIGNSANSINCTVEIDDNVQGSVTLKNIGADSFFRVDSNSSLTIKGTSDSRRIILDGGSNEGKQVEWEIIGTAGTLNLEYVTIQNNKNNAVGRWAPAIKVNPWSRNILGRTTIKHCIFKNLDCDLSPVMYVDGHALDSSVTSESCAIILEDTDICNCTVRQGDGRGGTDAGKCWGGLIRTRGGTTNNLYLTRVKMYNNNAEDCSCAGVFWNAMGDRKGGNRQPTLILNGCKFYGNTAKYSGGALRIETNCRFEGEQTEIYKNEAGIMGGGIHIYGYAGGYFDSQQFNYELNDKLFVHDNKAQYGAGIGIQLNGACTLKEGTNFNVHYNGAVINNNMATVKGGGIYYENIADASKNYTINLFLNKGEISGNKVAPDPNNPKFNNDDIIAKSFYDEQNSPDPDRLKSSGGGIFLYNANIGYESSKAGDMKMDGNQASRFGGALAVLGTEAVLNLQGLSASGNKAFRGGALACYSLTDDKTKYSTIKLGNLTLSENVATDYGGGAFIEKGKLEVLNGASISRCTATKRGGAVSGISNSIINIKNATLDGNVAYDHGGGIDLENSYLEISNAIFSGNTATSNGGGLYVEKTTEFRISEHAEFNNNTATNDGGGAICVKMNEGYSSTGTIENAYFTGNKAYRGGAIEIDGYRDYDADPDNVTLTLKNAEFTNNEANLGGAILVNEAKLIYQGGLIYGNRAKIREGSNLPKTSFGYFPYNWIVNCFHSYQFSGFGGGIIVSKMGSLIIEKNYPFGIYGNSADIAGNDISTVCSDTEKYTGGSNMDSRPDFKYYPAILTIPQPENLNLTGFKIPVPKSAVKWMEDYNAEDGAYFLGTNKFEESKGGPLVHERYSVLLKSADGIKTLNKLIVDDARMKSTKYLHLTLGYNFIFVKLVKKGLKAGDSAIFNISYNDGSNYTKYMTVSLTNTSDKDGTETSRIIALSAGEWKIEETAWAWAYNRQDTQQIITLNVDPDATTMRTITFTNTPKEDAAPHAEDYKSNEIKF